MSLDPLEHRYSLHCSPDHAFAVYTGQIGRWWHPDYTADADTFETVTIEPFVGGSVVERHRDGRTIEWGRVLEWRPGQRLVYTSSLAQSLERASQIDVSFAPRPGGCRVLLQHGGWTEANAADRKTFRQWPMILERFVALTQNHEPAEWRVASKQ
jgi:hypothetical protein